jgi:hypothetical protein
VAKAQETKKSLKENKKDCNDTKHWSVASLPTLGVLLSPCCKGSFRARLRKIRGEEVRKEISNSIVATRRTQDYQVLLPSGSRDSISVDRARSVIVLVVEGSRWRCAITSYS